MSFSVWYHIDVSIFSCALMQQSNCYWWKVVHAFTFHIKSWKYVHALVFACEYNQNILLKIVYKYLVLSCHPDGAACCQTVMDVMGWGGGGELHWTLHNSPLGANHSTNYTLHPFPHTCPLWKQRHLECFADLLHLIDNN